MLHDLRYSARTLLRAPGFALVSVANGRAALALRVDPIAALRGD